VINLPEEIMTNSITHWTTLYKNINIATMTEASKGYGIIKKGALAIAAGKIAWIGKQDDLPDFDQNTVEIIDGNNQWLTPGLIDCHTHIIYGGNRANEFELRLQGASYEDIANNGGGIISTVNATRQASEKTLFKSALKRLTAMQKQGLTTVEIKSGYGLNVETEVKMLKVATQLSKHLPITVKRTFLGAHALPTEFINDADGYIDLVINEMLPQIYKQQLADSVDVFCEGIGFNLAQTERVFKAAQQYKLPIKVHAEQLSDLGASKLAAQYQALSSEHLEFLSTHGIKAMAQADMTAVLLPGAFYFLRETKLPPIAQLREYNVAMAIATDANPGSSPIHSIQLMLNMACTLFRLTPVEALAGVTCHAAKALGINHYTGMLKVGYDADLALWDINQPAELCYQFGVNPLTRLIKQGERVI
jgi:imidazolonepropionase